MRMTAAASLAWVLCASACFEDAPPVDDGSATPSTGPECAAGTEGCPCLEDDCVGELMCLSNVCVDPSTTTGPTDPTSDSSATTAADDTGPMSDVDTGPPPMTTGSGGLPPGAACDPLFDECELGVACIGLEESGFVCIEPGDGGLGDACEGFTCAAGLLCIAADAFVSCSGLGCCAELCDFSKLDGCPADQFCEPFYVPGMAPPGYDDVGICVDFPG
ncbi:MAG: hypothetical protein AB1Z98_11065 [Nannocystaceae bacterium]